MALSEQARAVVQEVQRKHPQDYGDSITWKEIWEELENSRPYERVVEMYLLSGTETPASVAMWLKYEA